MIETVQALEGAKLLRAGSTDEDVEHLTGLSLIHIIELRAEAATAPPVHIDVARPSGVCPPRIW